MSKKKLCKYCKTEIDAKAKICPACAKKQKSGIGKILIAFIVIVIIVAALTSQNEDEPKTVNTSTDSKESSSSKDTSTEGKKTVFGVGESVELKDTITTLVSVKELEGSEYNKPADGNVFVLCEFNIENNSKEDLAISSIMSFEAYCDDYSTSLSLNGLLETDKKQLDGSIAAGKKMSGVVSYEVPENWKELEIKFTPSYWSGKEITFKAENK